MHRAWSRGQIAVLTLGSGLVAPARPARSDAVDAPGYRVRYLVPPAALQQTDGIALDGRGGAWLTQALSNRVVHLDLATGAVTRLAGETDAEPVRVPDDVAAGPDGDLYVTAMLDRAVVRMSRDGRHRKVVGSNLGDGSSLTNGIAFNRQGRLFATDLSFADPSHPGGMWELDPAGVRPPVPILRNLPTPEGFAFGPDGLAYVPEMFAGRIDVVDVEARTVRPLVDGFGYLVALKIDGQGRLLTLETDTGKLWRVDRATGARTFVAQGPTGLDNLAVAADGSIYVTDFVEGNVWRVDEGRQVMVPLLPERPLALPFSLSEAPDGALVVGDFTAVTRLTAAGPERLSRLLVDVGAASTPAKRVQLLTPGAVQVGDAVFYSDFLPPEGRIFRRDLATGRRDLVARGFALPWTVREGPAGHLLVGDQGLGAVFDVDVATGRSVPVVQGLRSPSGLAYDPAAHTVTVLIVEGDTGRLFRVGGGGRRDLVASGLPTRTTGIGLPLLNYSSDVLVRRDGAIVVSGDADGSLVELRAR